MKCENTKFFKHFGSVSLGSLLKVKLEDFQKFDQVLPDLSNVTFLGQGSDGACFLDTSPEEGKRVFKFGSWDNWRSTEDIFATNVSSSYHLIERMEKLLETNELCLPQVYRMVAFTNRLYFVEMEYLPFTAFGSAPADQRLIKDRDQYTGCIFYNEKVLAEASPAWQEWLMSYERLQALGFSHRDLHIENIRIDAQGRPKFIDLESFVHFIEEELKVA